MVGGGWDPKLGRCVGIAYVEGRKIDMVKQAGSQEDTEKCICLESSGTQLSDLCIMVRMPCPGCTT